MSDTNVVADASSANTEIWPDELLFEGFVSLFSFLLVKSRSAMKAELK